MIDNFHITGNLESTLQNQLWYAKGNLISLEKLHQPSERH